MSALSSNPKFRIKNETSLQPTHHLILLIHPYLSKRSSAISVGDNSLEKSRIIHAIYLQNQFVYLKKRDKIFEENSYTNRRWH